jgi:hypothetical protein
MPRIALSKDGVLVKVVMGSEEDIPIFESREPGLKGEILPDNVQVHFPVPTAANKVEF